MSVHVPIRPEETARLDLQGAFVRKTDLSHANLSKANLSEADLSGAILRGANLKGANLFRTVLKSADLRDVQNLTLEQLSQAIIDDQTLLPDYIARSKIKPLVTKKAGTPRRKSIKN